MFAKFIIDYSKNLFMELLDSVDFEDITNGRKGANLVDYKNGFVPIVRTTTIYNKPNQKFSLIHYDIINDIKAISGIEDLELNNALIEIYDDRYRSMKFHSDQSLDLAHDSYICIFSCYENPYLLEKDMRQLKIKNKTTNECSTLFLEHNSVIIFSTATNQRYVHKIVLESNNTNNRWLGMTFRMSKTFINFVDGISHLNDRVLMVTDNRDEIREFAKYKGIENSVIGYEYQEIYYTISVGDTIPIMK